jgi:Fe2+ transport system protein FeoA
VGLKCLNLGLVAEGQTDVVQSVQQAVAPECLNLKSKLLALGMTYDLTLKVHGQGKTGEGQTIVKEAGYQLVRQYDGQKAVL